MNEVEMAGLLARYADGTITESESAALLEFYRNDPAALQQAVRELAIHDLLDSMARQEELSARMKRSVASLDGSTAYNSRVKDRVLEALSPAKRSMWSRFAPAVLAAAAAILIALGVWKFGLEKSPVSGITAVSIRINAAAADAMLARGEKTMPAIKGMELTAGDRIKTGKSGPVVFVYEGDGTKVELKENGEIAIARSDSGKRVHLSSGLLSAAVASQQSGRPMVFQTPQADAVVVGTRLELQAKPNRTRLDVVEGKVRFSFNDDTNCVTVASGEFAEARADRGELTRYGEVLFKEDFTRGLEDWEVLMDNGDTSANPEDRPADETTRQLVSVVEMAGQKGRKCLQIDASSVPLGRAIGIKQKKSYGETAFMLAIEYEAVAASARAPNINMRWTACFDEISSSSSKLLFEKKIPQLALGVKNEVRSEYTLRQADKNLFRIETREYRVGEEVCGRELMGVADRLPGMRVMLSARNTRLQVSNIELRRMQRITRGK
ncbi:MAG: hypothetical protein C0404_12045 [Verrucomicrobia bacterium]|nr:hypothetical protein [Verrucomicrobiota bacterium]